MLDCWWYSQRNRDWAGEIKPGLQLWGGGSSRQPCKGTAGWCGRGWGVFAQLNQAETWIEGRRDGGRRRRGSSSDSSRGGAMGRGWSSRKWEAFLFFYTDTKEIRRNRPSHAEIDLQVPTAKTRTPSDHFPAPFQFKLHSSYILNAYISMSKLKGVCLFSQFNTLCNKQKPQVVVWLLFFLHCKC